VRSVAKWIWEKLAFGPRHDVGEIKSARDVVSSNKEFITSAADCPGHDQRYTIDTSTIQKDMGWVPEETLETGLWKTVDWCLNNSECYGHLQDGSRKRQRLGVIEHNQGAVG